MTGHFITSDLIVVPIDNRLSVLLQKFADSHYFRALDGKALGWLGKSAAEMIMFVSIRTSASFFPHFAANFLAVSGYVVFAAPTDALRFARERRLKLLPSRRVRVENNDISILLRENDLVALVKSKPAANVNWDCNLPL
jgi:hypothetical protein